MLANVRIKTYKAWFRRLGNNPALFYKNNLECVQIISKATKSQVVDTTKKILDTKFNTIM